MKEVAEWITAQNTLTFGYLEGLPIRKALRDRLTEVWNYPRTTLPRLHAKRLFYRKNSGLQRQAPIYLRASVTAPSVLLVDPNQDNAFWKNGDPELELNGRAAVLVLFWGQLAVLARVLIFAVAIASRSSRRCSSSRRDGLLAGRSWQLLSAES